MDQKALVTLEYPKVLERLSRYAAFSASAEMALSLQPVSDLEAALVEQARTTEARRMLITSAEVGMGGVEDVRPLIDLANHGGVLQPAELLSVRNTLIAARTIRHTFERLGEQFPHLTEIALTLPPPLGIIDAIGKAISERAEILDSASPKLASIRTELRIAHDRLMSRLQRYITDPKSTPMLQEAIITQRNGRYVLPMRAEYKGQLRSIIHDQSSSGATLFVEPLPIVEMNNKMRELQLAERDEERRILAELSLQIGDHVEILTVGVTALARLDFCFMRARYAEDLHAVEPVLLAFRDFQSKKHPGSIIRLYQARHPLLDQQTVVAIDADFDPDTYVLLITGPNTGGKTVTLKTVGLLALMAQSGLHIPAQSGSEITIFRAIFADIGDEQSIEQSLSTFSGHVRNIIHILEKADHFSLVLLDELGAGTDPQEGAALARAVLQHLLDMPVTTLVATHYPELKAYAHNTPGVTNASVEFDLHTLRPTYHLTIGLPGRSNALAIAERLGMPADIVAAARQTIHPDDLRAENLLDEIHRQRDAARQARAVAQKAQREAEALSAELAVRLEKVDDERRKLLETARAQAEQESAALRSEMEEIRRALTRARQPVEVVERLSEQLEQIEEKVEQPVERSLPPAPGSAALRLGDKVFIRSVRMNGVISTLGENEVEVQIGALRVRARRSDVVRASELKAEEPALAPARKRRSDTLAAPVTASAPKETFHSSPGMELDLRGQRAEDALDMVERYLENAYLAGMPFVRIIHGKGTGRLRQVVREALSQSPHVKSWEIGHEKEGGDGVTVAKLNSE
jgi:DNA mismatch repair protein MutS2